MEKKVLKEPIFIEEIVDIIRSRRASMTTSLLYMSLMKMAFLSALLI